MKEKTEIIIRILLGMVIALLFAFLMVKVIPDIFRPSHTIQDIYNWCCNNINSTISPTGDNCTNVINNIYGGKC